MLNHWVEQLREKKGHKMSRLGGAECREQIHGDVGAHSHCPHATAGLPSPRAESQQETQGLE